MLAAGIFVLIGVIILVVMIIRNRQEKPSEGSVLPAVEESDKEMNAPAYQASESVEEETESEPFQHDPYATEEGYLAQIRILNSELDKLKEENKTLKAQLSGNEGNQNESPFRKIKGDLINALKLYHEMDCNGAYEMQIKRQNYLLLIEKYISPDCYDKFFESGEVDKIKNGTDQYSSYEVTEETPYDVKRVITAIDVTCTDVDIETGTANYVIIYEVEETLPFDQGTNEVWRINYGRCSFDEKNNTWKFDEIYMLRTFTIAPTNEDVLSTYSEKWE